MSNHFESLKKIAGFILLVFVISGCGGGGGGGTSNPGPSSFTISGIASKGPIQAGAVTVYAVNTDGTKGRQLATAVTKGDGSFTIVVAEYSGHILIEVTGGTYPDEATGRSVALTSTLRASVSEVDIKGKQTFTMNVTPLTEIAVQIAEERTGGLNEGNIKAANTAVSRMVGLDILGTSPLDISASSTTMTIATTEQKDYGIMLAGISQALKDHAVDYPALPRLIAAIKSDLADGKLDTTGPVLSTVISAFVASSNNRLGLTLDQVNLDDYLAYITRPDAPPPARGPFNLIVTKTGRGFGVVKSSAPWAIDCGGLCEFPFIAGTTITLQAIPITGSVFTGWSPLSDSPCTGTTDTCLFTMDKAKSVVATFEPIPTGGTGGTNVNTLSVRKEGDGSGTITSSPPGINCGVSQSVCNADFPNGTQVTLTATPAAGSFFKGWFLSQCGLSTTCVFTMDETKLATVTFSKTDTVALSVTTTNPGLGFGFGTVTSSPAGINCGVSQGACTASFERGSSVTLTATANTGSVFSGWGLGCTGSTNPCTITMNEFKLVTAIFKTMVQLTIQKAGTGSGTVTSSDPIGIDCGAICSTSFADGTSVRLTAVPATGSTFAGWSGGGCSGTGACFVFMKAAKSVTATFTSSP